VTVSVNEIDGVITNPAATAGSATPTQLSTAHTAATSGA
jgi:hypothetical protein